MTGAALPYVALAAAGACIWAMPWVQGPTADGRSLDPSAPGSSAVSAGAVPLEWGSATDPAESHIEGRPADERRSADQRRSSTDSRATEDSRPETGDRVVGFPGGAAPLTTRPETLAIPSRGIRSPVVPVGLDAQQGVVVPEDVSVIGWYDASRPLGARRGATVLVGHRDSRVQGLGTLNDIESLPKGSILMVAGQDGTLHTYAVTSVEFIDKADLPSRAPEIFTRRGPHRLTLITCGGAFDEAARSYLANVVVTATPVSEAD